MSNYAIFFDYENKTYRIPVNPEEIEKTSVQAIERYVVLKLGQIGIPTHMELTEYSFETEFPHAYEEQSYIETSGDFKNTDFYLKLFSEWRNKLVPVRFIATNGIGDDINTLVLIESVKEVEKAGEEGDKYVSFKLLEYKDHRKMRVEIADITSLATGKSTGKRKTLLSNSPNPKAPGSYVIKSGDSLWSIAKKLYGDGTKCNIIFNANKDQIKKPGVIKAGQKLKIPAESEFSKYSAALPKIETKVAINKTDTPASSFTITGYQGGTTPSGRTHSSGGGSFGKTHSSGGGSF